MESPLNPQVGQVVYNALLGGLGLAVLYSAYHQMYDMKREMAAPFAALAAARDESAKADALTDILARLQADAAKKKLSSKISAGHYATSVVRLARLERDGSNAGSVSAAIQLLLRLYGSDDEGRERLNRAGGYRVLLATLSVAHRLGLADLMEETAEALQTLTQVDDTEVVLDADVPRGAGGAYTLAVLPTTVKMLGILDPAGSVLFLNALTGILANLCTLRAGALNIGKGIDGHSGVACFLRLLEHPNTSVVTNSINAIRFMLRAGVGAEEVAAPEGLELILPHLSVGSNPAIVNAILVIVLIMANNTTTGPTFFANFAATDGPKRIFELWVRSAERAIRSRAEVLCRLMLRIPGTAPVAAALHERYRQAIEERRARDEQEQQQRMQQMQQQQMMQRMMMEQMGMDPSMMGA